MLPELVYIGHMAIWGGKRKADNSKVPYFVLPRHSVHEGKNMLKEFPRTRKVLRILGDIFPVLLAVLFVFVALILVNCISVLYEA